METKVYGSITITKVEDGAGIKKIDTRVRSVPMATWKDDYAKRATIKWDTTSQNNNSHININDVAYIIGQVSDTIGSDGNPLDITFYGVVTKVEAGGITMIPSHLVMSGAKGSDGDTLYTWIKYADDAQGTNMSDVSNGKKYIGIAYNKDTVTESINASDYTWTLIKGEDGEPVDVISQTEQYCLGAITGEQPTESNSGWSTTMPNPWNSEGEKVNYVWKRQKTLWSNGQTTYLGIMLMSDFDVTNTLAKQDDISVGEWCKTKNVTIIDGATIITGSIAAAQIDADAIETRHIKSNAIVSDHINVDSLSAISANMGLLEAGIIQSEGYTLDTKGLKIDLDNSTFDSPNFKIDKDGNVDIAGIVTANEGKFGGCTINTDGSIVSNNGNFSISAEGNLTANGDGEIGGWEIGEKMLKSIPHNENSSSYVAGMYTGNDTSYRYKSLITGQSPIRFFCGVEPATDENEDVILATFMVLADGSLYAPAACFYGDNVKISDKAGNVFVLGNVIGQVQTQAGDIEGLTNRVTNLENSDPGGGNPGGGSTDELQTQIDNLQNTVNNLQTQVNNLQDRVTALESGSREDITTVTLDAEDFSSTNPTKDGITITMDKGNGTSSPAYNSANKEWRLYPDNTITIACTTGNITKIEFTPSSGYSIKLNPNVSSGTWTGNAASVTFTAYKNNTDTSSYVQTRITSIAVTHN